MISWEFLFALIPGIILFLYGIEQFSHEVQIAAGEYFRNLIQRMTRTPVRGTLVGTLVTALVQSSTATTVITVGLVNSGIISFTASLGIIFGANFGTTITSLLVALNLTAFAPVLILAGFLISIIGGKYIGIRQITFCREIQKTIRNRGEYSGWPEKWRVQGA